MENGVIFRHFQIFKKNTNIIELEFNDPVHVFGWWGKYTTLKIGAKN